MILPSSVVEALEDDGPDQVLKLVCKTIRAEGLKTPGQLIQRFSGSPIVTRLKGAFDYKPVLDVSYLKSELVSRLASSGRSSRTPPKPSGDVGACS